MVGRQGLEPSPLCANLSKEAQLRGTKQGRIANIGTFRQRSPTRGTQPRNVICQTRTPAARGVDGTEAPEPHLTIMKSVEPSVVVKRRTRLPSPSRRITVPVAGRED